MIIDNDNNNIIIIIIITVTTALPCQGPAGDGPREAEDGAPGAKVY